MNNDCTQRIPPQGDSREDEVGGLLAAASDFARGVLESIQALAGTTACKGVQIARLKEWAISHECWIDKDTLGTYSDRGSENEVYTSLDSRFVYKLNDFRYSDDNLSPFFERIIVHNQLFPGGREVTTPTTVFRLALANRALFNTGFSCRLLLVKVCFLLKKR